MLIDMDWKLKTLYNLCTVKGICECVCVCRCDVEFIIIIIIISIVFVETFHRSAYYHCILYVMCDAAIYYPYIRIQIIKRSN